MVVITLNHRWPHRRSTRVTRRDGRRRAIGDLVSGTLGAVIGGWAFVQYGPREPLGGLPGTIVAALVVGGGALGLVRLVRRQFA